MEHVKEKHNPRAINLRENLGPGFGTVNGSGVFTTGDAIVGGFPVEAEPPIERELRFEVEMLNLLEEKLLEEKLRILELRNGSVVSPSDPVPSSLHGRDTEGCSGVFQRLYENNHRLAGALDFIDDMTRRVEL